MKTRSPSRFYLRHTKKIVALFAVTAFGCQSLSVSLSAQEIVVDPDQNGSNNVFYDDAGFFVPLQNPVTNPLDLGDRELLIGQTGIGTLSVSGGASVTNGSAALGVLDDAIGEMRVDGAGSVWNIDGTNTLTVGEGRFSHGTLNITNGGFVDVSDGASAGSVLIGNSRTSNGTVNVDGPGSRLQTGTFLNVGGEFTGNANLNVTNGGVVSFSNNNGSVRFGHAADVKVDGAGSRIDGEGTRFQMVLDAGFEDFTRFTISNGGYARFNEAEIGVFSERPGAGTSVLVDGAGSQLDIDFTMELGDPFSSSDSEGEVTVSNGGTISVGNLVIAGNSDQVNGRVNIDSGGNFRVENTLLRNSSTDDVAGSLNFGGGTLTFAGDRTYDGVDRRRNLGAALTPVNGRIDAGMNLKVEGELDATSEIKIDGGSLSAGSIRNGSVINLQKGKLELTASNLDVSNSGLLGSTVALKTGQHLKVDQTITVAEAGRVELSGGRIGAGAFSNRGVITGSGRIDGPIQNLQDGKVIAAAGNNLFVSGSGSTNDWDIQMAGGTIQFDGNMTNRSDGRIAGRGMLMTGGTGLANEGDLLVSGGPMDIAGDVDNTGLVDVSGGGTATFYDDVVNNGTMRVVSVGNTHSSAVFYGSYSGAGDITGGGDVFMLGDLRPGNSPASISAAANIIFGFDTGTNLELAGLATGEFDQFLIDGDLSLAGDLDVGLIDGFLLDDDMEFMIFNVTGDVFGLFDGLGEGDLVGNYGSHDLFISYGAGDGNDISLRTFVSSVPEPGSLGLLFAIGLGLVARRKRIA